MVVIGHVGKKYSGIEFLQTLGRTPADTTQITLSSELLSQIRGSIVVLRDRIDKELGNLLNLVIY